MSPSIPNGGATSNGGEANHKNYIEHRVSKMDTLAGVAIKYGVEVSDIKRLNGLATDLQMFALKTLQIPLPGKHPPSNSLGEAFSPPSSPSPSSSSGKSNGKIPPRLGKSYAADSFSSLRLKPSEPHVSSAMNTLQKFYGLKPATLKGTAEGTEMAVIGARIPNYLDNDCLIPQASTLTYPDSDLYTSKSLGNGVFIAEKKDDPVPFIEPGDGEGDKSSEKSVRRRQKAEADVRPGTPDWLLKEENGSGSSRGSASSGKGLGMRPKSASRAALTTDSDSGWLNAIPIGLGDSVIPETRSGVRKSSSTPAFQDQESSSSSTSLWPTSRWSLKTDLQALSNVAIRTPIFDGLPKPITGRWSKAALD